MQTDDRGRRPHDHSGSRTRTSASLPQGDQDAIGVTLLSLMSGVPRARRREAGRRLHGRRRLGECLRHGQARRGRDRGVPPRPLLRRQLQRGDAADGAGRSPRVLMDPPGRRRTQGGDDPGGLEEGVGMPCAKIVHLPKAWTRCRRCRPDGSRTRNVYDACRRGSRARRRRRRGTRAPGSPSAAHRARRPGHGQAVTNDSSGARWEERHDHGATRTRHRVAPQEDQDAIAVTLLSLMSGFRGA